MRVIARQGSKAYPALMLRSVSRLFAILALLLMPMGMGAAAGAPAVATSAAAGEHCADHQLPAGDVPNDAQHSQALHCTACTGLPAADQIAVAADLQPATPRAIEMAEGFAAVEPELATPPPRRA